MYALFVCLFVCSAASASEAISGAAVPKWSKATDWVPSKMNFRYVRELGFLFRRTAAGEGCMLCYTENNCVAINYYRCEYYSRTNELLLDADNPDDPPVPIPQLRVEVDSMMFSLMDTASREPRYKDCIPLISRFTDCNIENICLGCKVCDCDLEGNWNCTKTRKCREDSLKLHANHRTLVMVMENLRSGGINAKRVKRANTTPAPASVRNVSDAFLSEWIFGNTPSNTNTSKGSINETTTEANINNVTLNITIEINDENKVQPLNDNPGEIDGNKVSFAEISEWLREFHPIDDKVNFSFNKQPSQDGIVDRDYMTMDQKEVNGFNFTGEDKRPTKSSIFTTILPNDNNENIAFDEVLNSLAEDNTTYSRRKPPLDMSPKQSLYDYVNSDEENTNLFNNYEFNDQPANVIDAVKDMNMVTGTTTESTLKGITVGDFTQHVTEVVIDLLQAHQLKPKIDFRNGKDIVFTDYYDTEMNPKDDKPPFEENKIDEINAVNVMKREVLFITTKPETTSAINNVTQLPVNITESIRDLKHLKKDVLIPLHNLLNDKHKEIDELYKMKENLISFLNNYKDVDFSLYTSLKKDKRKNAYLSFYKIEEVGQAATEFRANNNTLLEKYSAKLKRDVYEVIRDIVTVRKLLDPSNVPEDLKFLMRAMKHYVHKQGFHLNKKKTEINTRFTRRQLQPSDPASNFVQNNILKILESVDKNMPLSNGLNPLSHCTKTIVKRIIKNNFEDEFSVVGLRVYDPHYNLTSDLKNLGVQWQSLSKAIEVSTPSEKLYAMKMLHLELSADINKMNDALALINFAHIRRMVPVEENMGEEIMTKINTDLNEIVKKMSTMWKTPTQIEPVTDTLNWPATHKKSSRMHKPKLSFMKQIKHLLRSSKHDILDLLHKKIPKSEIFKELARKQLNVLTRKKMSEYEDTMKKWQQNLGIVTLKRKRSVEGLDKVRNRMRNIIPRYLRRKVPSLNKKHRSKDKKSNDTIYNKKKTATTKKKVAKTTVKPKTTPVSNKPKKR